MILGSRHFPLHKVYELSLFLAKIKTKNSLYLLG
jgi:hypothetical protein